MLFPSRFTLQSVGEDGVLRRKKGQSHRKVHTPQGNGHHTRGGCHSVRKILSETLLTPGGLLPSSHLVGRSPWVERDKETHLPLGHVLSTAQHC